MASTATPAVSTTRNADGSFEVTVVITGNERRLPVSGETTLGTILADNNIDASELVFRSSAGQLSTSSVISGPTVLTGAKAESNG